MNRLHTVPFKPTDAARPALPSRSLFVALGARLCPLLDRNARIDCRYPCTAPAAYVDAHAASLRASTPRDKSA